VPAELVSQENSHPNGACIPTEFVSQRSSCASGARFPTECASQHRQLPRVLCFSCHPWSEMQLVRLDQLQDGQSWRGQTHKTLALTAQIPFLFIVKSIACVKSSRQCPNSSHIARPLLSQNAGNKREGKAFSPLSLSPFRWTGGVRREAIWGLQIFRPSGQV
jgi:hypothetical protein